MDGVSQFTCQCRPGFQGTRCEIGRVQYDLLYNLYKDSCPLIG